MECTVPGACPSLDLIMLRNRLANSFSYSATIYLIYLVFCLQLPHGSKGDMEGSPCSDSKCAVSGKPSWSLSLASLSSWRLLRTFWTVPDLREGKEALRLLQLFMFYEQF